MPAFFALLPVRDEADIIGQCLDHALRWAGEVYVFDTGSVDNAWEIVQEFASRDKRVVPMRKEPVFFSEARLRGYMFHVARQKMREGDWFLRIDADEFHHITPPQFVKNCMRKHETVAYHQYYDFRLLQSDVDQWNRGEESLKDRQRPGCAQSFYTALQGHNFRQEIRGENIFVLLEKRGSNPAIAQGETGSVDGQH
jgi:glycosyltransferase involved in cell wall biosynthesis